ncbi:MAG TPA: DNA/RNA non-specific endonuclease [Noviherbaspirillum sp.]
MKNKLLAYALLLFSSIAIAQNSDCSHQYADGAAPSFSNRKLAAKTTQLCFEAFAIMHSGVTHTPLWAGEHLTRARVASARGMKRENTFHTEDYLPVSDRAELRDYSRSGYDRGHMAPSGDMPTRSAQHESFSLANMIPQNPDNNQNLWEGIESAVRTLATKRGSLYVLSGPIFEGASLKRLNGRVLVPTSIYKAVYDPNRQEAAAYITRNAPGMDYEVVSIAELESRVGINLFPAIPAHVKSTKMTLPEPTPSGFKNQRQGYAHRGGFNEGTAISAYTIYRLGKRLFN